MYRFKRPNGIWAANSEFDWQSMIALASSRILEKSWKVCRRFVQNFFFPFPQDHFAWIREVRFVGVSAQNRPAETGSVSLIGSTLAFGQ
jgi:hypothetical protein